MTNASAQLELEIKKHVPVSGVLQIIDDYRLCWDYDADFSVALYAISKARLTRRELLFGCAEAAVRYGVAEVVAHLLASEDTNLFRFLYNAAIQCQQIRVLRQLSFFARTTVWYYHAISRRRSRRECYSTSDLEGNVKDLEDAILRLEDGVA